MPTMPWGARAAGKLDQFADGWFARERFAAGWFATTCAVGPATLRRLLETLQMVAECTCNGAEGLRPGGAGWLAVLRVRM
jgi:hypothetical protein